MLLRATKKTDADRCQHPLFRSDKLFYFPSSKTTLTDYQCVSTGCCTHVAKTEITIDNQHVTKSLQRYRFLPKQPKENTEKITNLMISFDSDCLLQVCLSYICFSPVLYYVNVLEPFSELSLLPHEWGVTKNIKWS